MIHFVLVHGAFHGPWCFDPLVAELTRRGAICTAPELPLTSLAAEAAAVERALDEVTDRRTGPVLLLGHSYGGAVVTVAGNHPAVERLVLLASLAPDTGEPPSGGPVEIDPSFVSALRPVGVGLLEVDPARTAALFYPDATPAAAARLQPGATGLPHERIERAAWRERPTCYVVCADEPIVLHDSQRAIAARTGAEVVEIAGDHSPFLARPVAHRKNMRRPFPRRR